MTSRAAAGSRPGRRRIEAKGRPTPLTVVIVSFQAREHLRRCLDSIHRFGSRLSPRVMVVDNASTDGSAAMVRDEFTWVELIANSHNVGFAAANNQALRLCHTPYAMLLNNDAELTDAALERMLEFLDQTPDAGAVGCRLVGADGSWQPSASGLPTIRSIAFSYFGLRRLLPQSAAGRLLSVGPARRLIELVAPGYFQPRADRPHQVAFVSGACIMTRKAAWDQIGLLDESFFLYLEDSDWCRRMLDGGWKLYYLPGAEVVHVGGRSYAAVDDMDDYRMSPERCRSVLRYFSKHERQWKVMIVRALIATAMALRILGWRLGQALPAGRSRGGEGRRSLYPLVLRIALRGPKVATGR